MYLLALFAKRVYIQFMIAKVKQFMEKYHMVKSGGHVLVGLSGGADSVCLFFLLHLLGKEMDFQVSAVHVNHMLRGESADADSRFAKEFAKSLNHTCYCVSVLVQKLSEEEKLTLEEAGRKARYDVFLKTAKEIGADTIALAHHKNDQSETMLFHLARGCGISGLRGIKPIRQWQNESVKMIRPLLCVTRKEIEQFLLEQKIAYVIDETNGQNVYSRNKIRNRLIPFMEAELCEKTVEHMADTAELLGEAEDYLSLMANQAFGRIVRKDSENQNKYSILVKELEKEHSYIKGAVVKKALEQLANANKDLEKVHVESIVKLCEMSVGKSVSLPYQITAERGYEEIFLKKRSFNKEETEKNQSFCVSFDLPKPGQELEIPLQNQDVLIAKVMSYEEFAQANCPEKKGEVPDKPYTKWFDCDKIEKYLQVRFRETGDYFYLNDTDTKKVKAYFIHEKVPKEDRDLVYLVSQGKHVLWISGYRISHYYKITENTKQILQLTIRGGYTHGRET